MSRVTRDYPRQADEEYNTPAWVAVPIALWLAGQGVRLIWEPAPGSGRFASTLRTLGFEIYAPFGGDFLEAKVWHEGTDALVTNPPFGRNGELAEAFIRHALELEAPLAAFLLRVDFDSGKTRRDLFADCPFFAGKIVLLDRIVWFERKGAKPSENHAWFIWSRFGSTHRPGRPWIAYSQRDPDGDGQRPVGDPDQGRNRDRRPRRRVASPARQG